MKFNKNFLILFLLLASCKIDKASIVEEPLADRKKITALSYSVVTVYPHNDSAFTQGLVLHNGRLFESTGLNNSWIAEVDLVSGAHKKIAELDKKFFGEGITILNNKIYQLTWMDKTGFVYDLKTYKMVGEFKYKHEGWGITNDGHNLIISDGSEKLYFVDTTNFKQLHVVRVKDKNEKVKNLNELEFIQGYVYANQYESNYIYKIDPLSGVVVGKIDLSSIANEVKRMYPTSNVLNGIAYDEETNNLLITGKFWPRLYTLKLQ